MKPATPDAPGWQGLTVYPYRPSTNFGEAGQILYRKLDQRTGLPVPDTDTRADWAQDPDDIINGRKAQYPGWELDRFFLPRSVTEPATLEVSPRAGQLLCGDQDACWRVRLPASASRGIRSRMPRLGEIIAARARAGVAVEILLEGSPPGGVSDQQLWVVQTNRAGGRTHLLSPVQLNRRHSRPLHLSARQVLGAGWRHGADRQREHQLPKHSRTIAKPTAPSAAAAPTW